MGEEDAGIAADVQAIEGGLLVPTSFVIPAGDKRWPSMTWGHKLGRAVSGVRTRLADKASLSTEMRGAGQIGLRGELVSV